eukprot:1243726-Pleurochrysis_carterae.AAC.1
MARDCSRYKLTKTPSRANNLAVNLCIVKSVYEFSNTLDLQLIELGRASTALMLPAPDCPYLE